MCVCAEVCACECRGPWRPEKYIGFSGAGVTGNFKLPNMGAVNRTWVLCKNSTSSWLLRHLSLALVFSICFYLFVPLYSPSLSQTFHSSTSGAMSDRTWPGFTNLNQSINESTKAPSTALELYFRALYHITSSSRHLIMQIFSPFANPIFVSFYLQWFYF